ncbi:hypothetical protein JW859_14120 [bacterium]|nr:hypothetical protein [bacterium]
MSYPLVIRSTIVTAALFTVMGFGSSCGGGIDPALGARLIFEEELTDQLKAQIILEDRDLLNDEDDDEETFYGS